MQKGLYRNGVQPRPINMPTPKVGRIPARVIGMTPPKTVNLFSPNRESPQSLKSPQSPKTPKVQTPKEQKIEHQQGTQQNQTSNKTKTNRDPKQRFQQTPPRNDPVGSPSLLKRYLFYKPDCPFCKELLSILTEVPILATNLKCVDVNKYEVDNISSVPAIEEPETEKIFEANDAFTWVLMQCNKLLVQRKIKKEVVINIERRVRLTAYSAASKTPQDNTEGWHKREISNDPYESWRGRDSGGDLGDLTKQIRTRDEFQKLKADRIATPAIFKKDDSLMNERTRIKMLEDAKAKWIRQGLIDQHGNPTDATPRRQVARTPAVRKISERELRDYEEQRDRMLDGVVTRWKNEQVPKTPSVHKVSKLGSVLSM